MSDYKSFEIGKTFRVLSSKRSGMFSDRIELVMQRGAFGSGEHETTRSCLEILEGLPDLHGKHVLDLGSGTGILAIAALKLGAKQAVCVDVDRKAVDVSRINSALNDVDDRVKHIVGTLDAVEEQQFDLILANVYGDILLSAAQALSDKAPKGGLLVLSGILWELNFDVRQAYERSRCQIIRNSLLDEFSTILLKKF